MAVTDQFQRGLVEAITNLRKADPGITILGIRVVGFRAEDVTIIDPDMAYRSMKAKRLENMKYITERSDSYQIVSVYENLARIAKLARCNYIDQPSAVLYINDMLEFQRLSRPWIELNILF